MATPNSFSISAGFTRYGIVFLVSAVGGTDLFFYFFNSDIFYNRIGLWDPFTGIGLGLYYDWPQFWEGYYKTSRVPWIALEYVTRHIFLPSTAGLVLQLIFDAVASCALFLAARLIGNWQSAYVIAVLSITLPLFHLNSGVDYHNGISGALFFVSFACLLHAITRGSLLAALSFGAASAGSLWTNPLFILLMPAFALSGYARAVQSHRAIGQVAIYMGAMVGGFVVANVAFAIISAAAGRNWAFYQPMVDYIRFMHDNPDQNVWWRPISWDTLRNSPANAFMIGGVALSIAEMALIVLQRQLKRNLDHAAIYVGYLITYLIALSYQIRHQTTLIPDYLGYIFNAAAIFPLYSALDRHLPLIKSCRMHLLLVIAMPLLFVTVLILYAPYARPTVYLASFTLVLMTYLLLYGFLLSAKWTGCVPPLAVLTLLNASLIFSPSAYTRNKCHSVQHLNVLISTISTKATSIAGNPNRVFVWANRTEKTGNRNLCFKDLSVEGFVNSLTSTGHYRLGDSYPLTLLESLKAADFGRAALKSGTIILITAHPLIITQFKEKATFLGYDLPLQGLYTDARSGLTFHFFGPVSLARQE